MLKSKPHTIVVFWLLIMSTQPSLAAEGHLAAHKIFTIGGIENPLLSLPTDVAVSAKHILVVDGGNHRVAAFDLKGRSKVEDVSWRNPLSEI